MIVLVLISTPLPNYSLRSSIATTSFCIVQAKEKADLRRGSLNNRTISLLVLEGKCLFASAVLHCSFFDNIIGSRVKHSNYVSGTFLS